MSRSSPYPSRQITIQDVIRDKERRDRVARKTEREALREDRKQKKEAVKGPSLGLEES